jgi:hypothetical protein
MALSKKDAQRTLKELHKANKDYFVKTLNLGEEESEFLLNAWKTYIKERPELLKHSPFRCLDSFIHGFLAHVVFTRAKRGHTTLSALPSQRLGQK